VRLDIDRDEPRLVRETLLSRMLRIEFLFGDRDPPIQVIPSLRRKEVFGHLDHGGAGVSVEEGR
jgi:hypothetical protein